MTSQEPTTAQPPDADTILQQFRSPLLLCCRYMVLSGLRIVKFIRRINWTVQGTKNITSIDGPLIFVANHQSHVDTHVILAAIPSSIRKTTAVAAAYDHFADSDGTSRKKRVIQFVVAAVWHAFGIERHKSPLRSIRTMNDLIDRGWSIVIYPEGTRSRTGCIADFKPGFALIAKKCGRPVIPVHINGGLNILPEATYFPRSGEMAVSFGSALQFENGESSSEFMARVEASVRHMANCS